MYESLRDDGLASPGAEFPDADLDGDLAYQFKHRHPRGNNDYRDRKRVLKRRPFNEGSGSRVLSEGEYSERRTRDFTLPRVSLP